MRAIITKLLMTCALVTPLFLQAQWQNLDSGTEADLQDIYFFDENYGAAVGGEGTVLLTTDGGDNWTSIGGNLSGELTSVVIWNVDTLLVGSGNIFESVLYQTTDGGTTWEEVEAASELALAGGRAHGLRYDALIYSDNAGTDWTNTGTGIGGTTLLEELVFADSSYGQAIGNIGGFATYSVFALMTADAGATWQSWFVFDLPSGDAWTATAYPHPDTLFLFTNQFDGFLPSDSNKLVRLTDFSYDATPGVESWRFSAETVNDTMPTYINAGYFRNGSSGFAAGADGNLYHTADGGVSWEAEYSGTDSLFGLFFVNNETGYAVGQNGTILRQQAPSGINRPTIGQLKLFPNPTGSSFSLEGITDPEGTLWIFDASGRLCKTEKWRPGQEVDVKSLSPGLYALRLQTGKALFSGKLSKTK